MEKNRHSQPQPYGNGGQIKGQASSVLSGDPLGRRSRFYQQADAYRLPARGFTLSAGSHPGGEAIDG